MKYFVIILVIIFACPVMLGQLTAPTLFLVSGGSSCINFCQVGFFEHNSGPLACWTFTLNGTTPATPTAATAGTCDTANNEQSTFSTTYMWAPVNCGTGQTLKISAIFTQVAQTNSSVSSATYPCSASGTTGYATINKPLNLTANTGNLIDAEPVLAQGADGVIYEFDDACNCGLSPDNASYLGWIAYRYCTISTGCASGSNWTKGSNSECPGGSDPATGCLYDVSAMNRAHYVLGVTPVADSAGWIVVAIAQDAGATFFGVLIKRCNTSTTNCTVGTNWQNAYFLTTPTYTSANDFTNPTSNILTIPPNAPGVTGTCQNANGCLLMTVLGENAGISGVLYNTNHGASGSWTDPFNFGTSVDPATTEEVAMFWLPGTNNLGMFARPGTNGVTNGGPTSMAFRFSSNLGQTWNTYTPVSNTYTGNSTNYPIYACGVANQVSWTWTPTRPSIIVLPNNSNLGALFWGIRLSCAAAPASQPANFWQAGTFNLSSTFTNAAQNLPAQQSFNLFPAQTPQLHTTYSFVAPLNSTQALFAYEQGNSSTTMDVMVSPTNFPTGQVINGNTSFSGGVSVQ